MTEIADAPAPKAGRREWIGLSVLALPCMLYSMDLTVLHLAVPALTADLAPSASGLLWIIDIYGFMVAGFLIVMGALGDRIGRRKLLMIGAAAFGAASVLAALADSAETLIAARAVLGVAGATIAPSTLSLISNMFRDPGERAFAIGMWITSFSGGAVIGPVVGGLVIEAFDWPAVFLIAVPPMLLLLAVAPRYLPEYRDPRAGLPDLASAALSLVAVLATVFGVKRAAEIGVDAVALGAVLAGAALGAAFLARQRRLADPMVDPALFRSPTFRAALAINVVSLFFMFGVFMVSAQFYQLVAGLSPSEAGIASAVSAAVFALMAFAMPALTALLRPASLIALGLAVAGVGLGLTAVATEVVGVVLASVVIAVGFTPVMTLTTGLVLASAPPERAGAASGLSETVAELGGALGIALLGALGAAIYRLGMGAGALEGVPDAEAARATLAGALEAASRVATPEAAANLAATARAAFMTGFFWIAALGAAAILLAALGALWFRRAIEAPSAATAA